MSLLLLLCAFLPAAVWAQPNHHLHNFGPGAPAAEHALAMGYRLLVTRGPGGAQPPEGIGRIGLHNANVGPIRLYRRKRDGKLFVQYHSYLRRRQDNLNPLALMHGFNREDAAAPSTYPLAAEDFEILRNYSAARRDNSDLQAASVTFETVRQRFYTAWPTANAEWESCNLLGNWQSRKVVNDYVAFTTTDFPWERYDALFFDSFASHSGARAANASYGGQGSYPERAEGAIDMVRRISEYARDPSRTGNARPLLIFTNIYDLHAGHHRKTVFVEYGTGGLRLDHYYFEKGGFGTQGPNGVVPGTDLPAYVNPENPRAYIPAGKVALDDTYAFVNRHLADYDRGQHFLQHLDACGTAGLHGAWFGWYGEDNVDLKDASGRLVFTNDLQLLRAIPNWDNLSGIPVPRFRKPSQEDQRHWDGAVYRSANSFASKDAMWSRHPDTGELFVVFRSMEGLLRERRSPARISPTIGSAVLARTHNLPFWRRTTARSA